MIYGGVYKTACKSNTTYEHYELKPVQASIASKEIELMRLDLIKRFPNTPQEKIKVKSSKDLFGSATNVCVITWTNTGNNCSYDVLYVQFGISKEDAYNRALKHKKETADNVDATTKILEEEPFQK